MWRSQARACLDFYCSAYDSLLLTHFPRSTLNNINSDSRWNWIWPWKSSNGGWCSRNGGVLRDWNHSTRILNIIYNADTNFLLTSRSIATTLHISFSITDPRTPRFVPIPIASVSIIYASSSASYTSNRRTNFELRFSLFDSFIASIHAFDDNGKAEHSTCLDVGHIRDGCFE